MPRAQTNKWLETLLIHWREFGYGRFLVWRADIFVGVVGLSRTDFDAGIVPGVEIAWRLAFNQWGKGYATEAARAAIRDAFERVGLDEVVSVTTRDNARSVDVMKRLGMAPAPGDTFEHPRLPEGDPHRTHIVYRLTRSALSARPGAG